MYLHGVRLYTFFFYFSYAYSHVFCAGICLDELVHHKLLFQEWACYRYFYSINNSVNNLRDIRELDVINCLRNSELFDGL